MISIGSMVHALIVLIVGGLICWLAWWFIGYIGLPEPFNKVARVIVAVVAFLICMAVLLSFLGYSIFVP